MTVPRVMTVVGTRPELIRLSRVIELLDRTIDHTLIHTGQNFDPQLSQVFLDELRIRPPDEYLSVDTSSLGRSIADTIAGTERAILRYRPDALLVLGDTNSALAAIIAKRMNVAVYHLEAGNRSFDSNVPEETNRRIVDHVADFNLPYSEHARRNLLAEGLPPRRIALTGSPMREVLDFYRDRFEASGILEALQLEAGGFVVVSAHRQENIDNPERLGRLLDTLESVSAEWDVPVLVSTHPRMRARIDDVGDSALQANVRFHPPFGFFDYIQLQRTALCVLSDSGTISEEAAILGFPAVTLRDSMERPEALENGSILMAGLNADEVIAAMHHVIESSAAVPSIPAEYLVTDFSRRVVGFMLSTMSRHREWAGIRGSTAS